MSWENINQTLAVLSIACDHSFESNLAGVPWWLYISSYFISHLLRQQLLLSHLMHINIYIHIYTLFEKLADNHQEEKVNARERGRRAVTVAFRGKVFTSGFAVDQSHLPRPAAGPGARSSCLIFSLCCIISGTKLVEYPDGHLGVSGQQTTKRKKNEEKVGVIFLCWLKMASFFLWVY